MSEPAWIVEARRHIGVREIKGPQHHPSIVGWWRLIKRGGIKDDETAWCAAYVGGCLEAVGLMSSRFEGARSYLDWGVGLANPAHGAVAVLSRPGGGGHVGFVVGGDTGGSIALLGGNQGHRVSVAIFARDRMLGYRWPAAVPQPEVRPLMLVNAAESASEA